MTVTDASTARDDFADLDEFLEVDKPKQLTISGKTYTFPGRVPADVGVLLLRMQHGEFTEEDMDPDTAKHIYGAILGDGRQQLDDDSILGERRARVLQTLTAWHMLGRDAALQVWAGKATAPGSRADRRRKPSKTSKSTASARKTR